MDTEKQKQRRCDDARLTESGNARSEQLLVVPTESLNQQSLASLGQPRVVASTLPLLLGIHLEVITVSLW